tara:strand:+ start:1848 stop:2807 length:960 start_codon:yes stop_codon:yes gene_type:complete
MKIINIPIKYSIVDYKNAINKQVDYFSKLEGVKSIYQIGGVSTPGVSDIDLVVVFKNGYKYDLNPKVNNDDIGNYLFTHGLYGASEDHFNMSLRFTFFHNFKLLYGLDLDLGNTTSEPDQLLLKEQIALEFLFKMYVNLVVQKSYNTIKLRSLFLHIKALPYDFEFLNIHPHELLNIIERGILLRNNWFSGDISKSDVEKWFKHFFKVYKTFLVSLFKNYSMYASSLKFKIAPNIEINSATSLGYTKRGIVFPDLFNVLDKKYFKALNKLNDFKIDVPLSSNTPKIIKDYFVYADDAANYNKKQIPHFMTLTSSLKIYK